MDKNDIKSMWHEAHNTSDEIIIDKESIEKAITKTHSKTIFKTLLDIKLKVFVFTLILAIYVGLMLYALVYLGLNLSVYSLVPLTLAGFFLLIKTTSEIVRLLVLTKTADNMSVKDSLLFFRKRLNRIKKIDFISYLVFLYLSSILIIFNYLTDIGGVKNLSWGHEVLPVPLLGILILMLLLIPWFIKYQDNRMYRKLYSNLNESARHLDDTSGTISRK
jgi:hypothetical protein